MMPRRFALVLIALFTVSAIGSGALRAADEEKPADASKAAAAPQKSKFEQLTTGAKKVEGLWTVHYKDQQVLVELPSGHLDKNFIVLSSIARGVSNGGMVLGGMSWGDDVVWSFKKVGESIHVLRRNVRFRANPNSPEASAVKIAYSDSVLYAVPIQTSTPSGGHLIDMTSIFMSDDQQIGRSIGPGFRFAGDRSTVSAVKSFEKNVEIQVAAVYSGSVEMDSVSDPRGVQVHVHYSISMLPSNGYKPRKADDRVGYFLSVLKDYSDRDADENFVRYINRWDLKKKDADAALSPPEKPIKFYMEKSVPVNLRPYVRSGILEWNKAFEKLGFSHAIEVEQQPDDATWDPEDINYNTFRWITAEAGFAMGPSRVNPLTGQILDADIIFDASFLKYWKQDYETFTPSDVAMLTGGRMHAAEDPIHQFKLTDQHSHHDCQLCKGMQQQMGFAAAALSATGAAKKGKLPDEFVHQALKEVVMHEVGHTLGLRHNFKASSWKPLGEIEGLAAHDQATVASVMDYSPANIAPEGKTQGLYYTQTIGPYDYWAIEYGYKPISSKEDEELKKIAARGAEAGLDYATDEDTRGVDPDPLSNRFDLGADAVEYAKRQMTVSTALLPKVLERTVEDGDGYQRARQAFGMLLSEYWRTAYFASRIPGGVLVHRDHKGDPNARAPFKLVEAAKQREAMDLLAQTAFAAPTYDADLLNHLAATRWSHWGLRDSSRLDYPIHETVERMQSMILSQLLNPLTLRRLHDSELKVSAEAETYTLAEHLRRTTDALFTELKDAKPGEYTNRTPYISSFRRNLQRMGLKNVVSLVTSSYGYPEDARTLARMHLIELDKQIEALLGKNDVKLDDYTRAHLLDSQTRVRQVLNAELQVNSVN